MLDWYDAHPDAIVPDFRKNEVLGFVKGGLQDFSISRKTLKWGIPLPWDDRHVTYVWFDALANYITAHGYGSDDARFAAHWPVDWHFIGKDIIRFHCVYWPAMLMSQVSSRRRAGRSADSCWSAARRCRRPPATS